MITYQNLVEYKSDAYVMQIINEYKGSEMYKTACDAEQYARKRNPTITKYQKLLYTLTGKTVPDYISSNHKCASNFFGRFITQLTQYLLGNGVTFNDESTYKKLGDDFDIKVQKAGRWSLIGGASYGFWNYDHLEVFKATEFAPLWDEYTGALRAGVRFWQLASDKPIRATLYEEDGYTEYVSDSGQLKILEDKRNYKEFVRTSKADGTYIYDGENYEGFPIVPLWANEFHQSDIIGIRESIDCYDLIKSGFANDLDDASVIYWVLTNSGGMDDIDLAKFIERMKTVKVVTVDSDVGQSVSAHTLDVPYQSREVYLNMLSADLYRDAMALDTEKISNGAITATQIRAAYEPLNNRTDEWEYCVIDFIKGILALAGIDDDPTFTRSKIVNVQDEINVLVQSAEYLEDDYVTEKILALLGDKDRLEEVLSKKDDAEINKWTREEERSTMNSTGSRDESTVNIEEP